MKTYIDVGCNVGYYSFIWLKDPDAIVYAFEPNPVLYKALKEKETNRFRVFDNAIGTDEGIKKFNIGVNPGTSSLMNFLPNNNPHKIEQTIDVEVIRLDAFCTKHKISNIDLIKIDAQGSDLDVLKSLGDNISFTDKILIEAFLDGNDIVYEGEVKEHEIMEYIAKHNFNLISRALCGNYVDLLFEKQK